MEQVHRCNVGTNRYHQRKMLEEVLRLQVGRRTGKRTYHLSREGFNCAVNHLLPEDVQKSNHISYEDFVK